MIIIVLIYQWNFKVFLFLWYNIRENEVGEVNWNEDTIIHDFLHILQGNSVKLIILILLKVCAYTEYNEF